MYKKLHCFVISISIYIYFCDELRQIYINNNRCNQNMSSKDNPLSDKKYITHHQNTADIYLFIYIYIRETDTSSLVYQYRE